MKKDIGKDYYDHTHDHSSSTGTTWDHIIKSNRLKTFQDFDRDGEFAACSPSSRPCLFATRCFEAAWP